MTSINNSHLTNRLGGCRSCCTGDRLCYKYLRI
nr:MAG TPA: hypothetical protein [Caudoviricetes sp.]